MKRAITLLTLLLSLAMFTSTAVQAQDLQQVVIKQAPAKMNKIIFAKLLTKNGISKQEFKQIGGMKQVVNSLRQKSGKWTVSMNQAQVSQMVKFSGGKIKSIVGFGSFSFADVTLGGTKI